jgi:hypothetical protein
MGKKRARSQKASTTGQLTGSELYAFEQMGRYIKYLAQQLINAKLDCDAMAPWSGHMAGTHRLIGMADSWTQCWAQLNLSIADCDLNDPINMKVAEQIAKQGREFPYA